jgi:hypothetical protein
MPARGRGSQARSEQRRAGTDKTDYGTAQTARKAQEREVRARLSIAWLDEPRPLASRSAIKVVGVSSDAAPDVLAEWLPIEQRIAA